MVGSDEPIWLGLTGREIGMLVTALILFVIFVYHWCRYKVWNWLALVLMLSPWPIFWLIRWHIEGKL